MCVTIQRKQLCIWICIYNKSTVSAHICCRSLKQKSLKHVSMSSMLYIYFYIHIHFMKIYVDQFDTAYKIIKNIRCNISYEENGSKNHSVVSDSSWPHGLYSSWNSSRQNTGMGSCSLSREFSDPGTERRCATLQADSLLSKPPGKPTDNYRKWLFIVLKLQ